MCELVTLLCYSLILPIMSASLIKCALISIGCDLRLHRLSWQREPTPSAGWGRVSSGWAPVCHDHLVTCKRLCTMPTGAAALVSSTPQLLSFSVPEPKHSGQSQLKSGLPWGQNTACHSPCSSQKGGQDTTGESFHSVRNLLWVSPEATGMTIVPLDGREAPSRRPPGPCRQLSAPAHCLAAFGTVSNFMLEGPVC